MAHRLSTDARNSLYLVFVVGGLFAFVYFGARYLPIDDQSQPHWGNLYLWSSSESAGGYAWLWPFLATAGSVNNAPGRPPRPWLESAALILGVSGILLVATLAAHDLPHVAVFDSFLYAVIGGTCGRFFIEGAPARVGRNLITRDINYAGRFLPLLGTVLCLLFLGFLAWNVDRRGAAHDYTSIIDVACFVVGFVCVPIGGKRREQPVSSAAIA
jgi:hypothetical protein